MTKFIFTYVCMSKDNFFFLPQTGNTDVSGCRGLYITTGDVVLVKLQHQILRITSSCYKSVTVKHRYEDNISLGSLHT